jgi:hypothetical protein
MGAEMTLKKIPSCLQRVLKFPNVLPKMFPIAPRFYPIWFAQSSTPMYINSNDEI